MRLLDQYNFWYIVWYWTVRCNALYRPCVSDEWATKENKEEKRDAQRIYSPRTQLIRFTCWQDHLKSAILPSIFENIDRRGICLEPNPQQGNYSVLMWILQEDWILINKGISTDQRTVQRGESEQIYFEYWADVYKNPEQLSRTKEGSRDIRTNRQRFLCLHKGMSTSGWRSYITCCFLC